MTNLGNRIVVLIDMDCFFCQVETKLQPEYAGKPLAVVQYNLWRSGGIIAVNYEAREFGVTRHMRGDEAKEKCPDIILATVPSLRGKSDTSRYRNAGREVIQVLKKHCNLVERASVDEAYLDITQIVDEKLSQNSNLENLHIELGYTFVVGYSDSKSNDEDQRSSGLKQWFTEFSGDEQVRRLATAGKFIEELRRDIYDTTGFRCSAGISFNKILAKLACGMHKPNRQTILTEAAVPELFSTLPVKKVRNLGGKLGDVVIESLKCNVMSDLLQYSLQYLQDRFDGKTGLWLYNIARGHDSEPVNPRLVSKSIGVCKRFPGKQAIVKLDILKNWIKDLATEVSERLEQDSEENERRATLLTVSFQIYENKTCVSQSRSCPLLSYKTEKLADQVLGIVTKAARQNPVAYLGISVGKFVKARGSENFMNFFKKVEDKPEPEQNEISVDQDEEAHLKVKLDNVNSFSNETPLKNTSFNLDNSSNMKELVGKNTLTPEEDPKKQKASPCTTLQKSLKVDNFSKSFFMNVFRKNYSNEIQDESSDCTSTVKSQEHITSENSYNQNTVEFSHYTDQSDPAIPEEKSMFNDTALSKLQEIFPDLNDLDINIVRLLPMDLQEEAKKIMKAKKSKCNNESPNHKQISPKGRKCKSTAEKGKNSIQNFFIKTVNKEHFENFKTCSVCGQLIAVGNFQSHQDFHLAQDLQRDLNRESIQDETRKRKVSETNDGHYVKKRISGEIDIAH